jgi:hypothetical protein
VGLVLWVTDQQAGDDYNGVSLWETRAGEILFIGPPWATYA